MGLVGQLRRHFLPYWKTVIIVFLPVVALPLMLSQFKVSSRYNQFVENQMQIKYDKNQNFIENFPPTILIKLLFSFYLL